MRCRHTSTTSAVVTREQRVTVYMAIAVLTLIGLVELYGVYLLVEFFQTTEQQSIQIHAPYSPPSKDTVTWIGN